MDQKKRFKLSFSGKIWRRILWTISVLAGLYLLLLVSLSIYASSSREKLMGFLNARLNETILGELRIDKAEITVWQTFPRLGITLKNVSINDSFYHRPFLKAGSVTAKLSFLGLISNKLNINSVEIKNAQVYTFTDSKGYTNSYVLQSQNKPGRAKKKPLVFNNLELENVRLISEDAIKNKRYEATVYDADINMRLSGSKYHIKFDEDILIRGLGFNLSKGYWLENQRLQGKWKLEYDTANKVLSFNNTKIEIQDHTFTIKGIFFLKTPAHFHFEAATEDISYGAAMAILKPTTSKKIKKLNLSEPLNAKVLLDGPLAYKSDPFVKIDFNTANTDINTPVINFSECSFSGNFINQVDSNLLPTDNNSRVSINAFTSNWGDINIKAQNITITDLLKPTIKFELFSQCTLPQLDEQLSSSALHFVDGNAKLYLGYDGPLIADPSLLDRLNAKIEIQNGKIVYVPRSITFSECNGTIDITGNNLQVNNLQCNLNTNHFTVNIAGQNLNRLSNNEAGNASINCNVYSPALDLTDFKALFAQKTKVVKNKTGKTLGKTASAIDNALDNGDLFINVKAKQLSLHHFMANNVIANVAFKNDDWEIRQASLQHADGNIGFTAKVHQVNNGVHQVNAVLNLQHIDVAKLFYGFDNFGQTGITYNNIKGIMDSKINIDAVVNSSGKFIPASMNGKMFFSLKDAALINLESLKNLQQFIFKNRNLDSVEFTKLENTFDIKKGDIYIPRMPIQSSAITMYIEGVYSFADRTDISIQVPLSSLTKRPENYKEIDAANAENPGASIYLRARDKDGQFKIGLDAFKKSRKNKHKKDK